MERTYISISRADREARQQLYAPQICQHCNQLTITHYSLIPNWASIGFPTSVPSSVIGNIKMFGGFIAELVALTAMWLAVFVVCLAV